MISDGGPVQPGDIGKPRARPQALGGQEHALRGHRHRRNAPEQRTPEHPDNATKLVPHGFGGGLPQPPFRNYEGDGRRTTKRHDAEDHEHAAPIGDGQDRFHWHRAGDRAQAPGRHLQAVDERNAFAGEPHHIGFERRHQARRRTEPDQRAAGNQVRCAAGDRKQKGPQGREQQQHRFRAPGSETVKQDSQRQLGDSEGEEVGAGQKPQIGRREP